MDMKFLAKFLNPFKKETWTKIEEQDSSIGVYRYGSLWKVVPAKLETYQSNKGGSKYFLTELEGYNKGKTYEVDNVTRRPK